VLPTAEDGSVVRQVRRFGTMMADRLEISDWLEPQEVTHIAMEATGVYWRCGQKCSASLGRKISPGCVPNWGACAHTRGS
jgi:hypothetical protein